MDNNLYLIHKDDYLTHIDNQIHFYVMVKQLAINIKRLAPNRGSKKLDKMAETFNSIAESMFKSLGIPKSYILFGDEDGLTELTENELIAPEDAGYYPCDDECESFPCTCGGCCEAEDEYDEEDEDEYIAEMMVELSNFIHSIFGDSVSVHIVVE